MNSNRKRQSARSLPKKLVRAFKALARRKVAAIVFCGMMAFSVGAIFSAIRINVPQFHDEFSYLLAADTFAQGRFANPTHPMWHHFETFHVIHQPSYASKYLPGQGLILAVGQAAAGHPIVGAWLSAAFAAAAVCWMLQGWMPPKWALAGGLLVALHGMLQLHWGISYWGGFLPMTGGALMFGAIRRIMRLTKWTDAVILASGAVILVFTRPFEGAVIGCCISLWLAGWMLMGKRSRLTKVLIHLVLPSSLVLGMGLFALGWYNVKVTGSPFLLPYQLHEQQYAYVPLFLWKAPNESIEYRHEAMRDFWTHWAAEEYNKQQTLIGWIQAKAKKIYEIGCIFLGPALWILLLLAWPIIRRRRFRMVWVTLIVAVCAQLSVPWMYPHYFAPAAPLLFLLVAQAMRHWIGWSRRGLLVGKWMPLIVALIQLIALPAILIDYSRDQLNDWQWNRARVQNELESTPGNHLVIVRYLGDHYSHREWVFNRADIDSAKVVWAREMDEVNNRELLNYFSDRKVWLLEADLPRPIPRRMESLDSISGRSFVGTPSIGQTKH